MLIYLGRWMAVGFFASYDHGCGGGCSGGCGWVWLMTWRTAWWSSEAAAKSSHCGKGGWTRLFAFAYTRAVSSGTDRLRAGQFEQHWYDLFALAAD